MLCYALSYPSAFVIIAVGWVSAPTRTWPQWLTSSNIEWHSIVKQLLEQLTGLVYSTRFCFMSLCSLTA